MLSRAHGKISPAINPMLFITKSNPVSGLPVYRQQGCVFSIKRNPVRGCLFIDNKPMSSPSKENPVRGCLFIARRSPPFDLLFFSGARLDRREMPYAPNRAPLKNKKEEGGRAPGYKQATPSGVSRIQRLNLGAG